VSKPNATFSPTLASRGEGFFFARNESGNRLQLTFDRVGTAHHLTDVRDVMVIPRYAADLAVPHSGQRSGMLS
jgi:hypothetical protein